MTTPQPNERADILSNINEVVDILMSELLRCWTAQDILGAEMAKARLLAIGIKVETLLPADDALAVKIVKAVIAEKRAGEQRRKARAR